MKRNFKILVVGLILFVMMCIKISYAIDIPEEESFFSVNTTEISQGEILEMIIDLTQIEYEQFEIRISSDIEVKDMYTDEDLSEEVEVEIGEEEEKNITITIDKNSLNAEQISLYYQIPEDMEIGTVITFKAVLVYEEEETNVELEVAIVEGEEEENNENQEEMKNNSLEESTQSSDMQTVSMSSSTSVSSSTTSKTETVTYNGSNNNYLETLEIEGFELTTEFNKDRLTYFANVEDVTEITVIATPEDDSAKVSITGTDNLKEGENKILISVTAENGDVRYYRIYVTLEAEE